jgi:hypothetical protein
VTKKVVGVFVRFRYLKSRIAGEVVFKSIKRLYNNSKCSRESLSTWGERNTQKRLIL